MKKLIFILAMVTTTISCRAQTTIIALDDPISYPNATLPIYRKDVNNVRQPVLGIWRGSEGNRELTIYLYKVDGVPNGFYGPQNKQFKDGIRGYYIYKENGDVVLDTRDKAVNPPDGNPMFSPIAGFTSNGIDITGLRFDDYGISMEEEDGSMSDGKTGVADMIINNPGGSPLQATFKLFNMEQLRAYNYNFSVPKNLVLTKISNIAPTLD